MKFFISMLLLACMTLVQADDTVLEEPTLIDVIGLSEQQLRAKYPQTTILDSSFRNLVSKNLHAYFMPRDHVFLRYGKTYLVFELKDGVVIALHKVSG